MKVKVTLFFLLALIVCSPAMAQKAGHDDKLSYRDYAAATFKAAATPAPGITISQQDIVDYICVTAPGNPPVGKIRVYCDSGTGKLTCIDSTGANVCASGGGSPAGANNTLQKNSSGFFAASKVTDDGTTVAVGADAQFLGPNPFADPRAYGKFATASSTTANTVSGSAAIALTAASNFKNGEYATAYNAGAACSLTAPSAPTVTPSVNSGGVGTVAAGTGASAFAYEVIAVDKNGCYTAASTSGSTSTGNALGLQSSTITTMSRTGQTVTVNTSAPHGYVVDEMVHIKYFTSSDASFEGFWMVATVPTASSFTFTTGINSPTTVNATGGTVQGFNGNAVTWPAVTNAWKYFIYGRTGGVFTVLGQSLSTSWVDYGSPMNDNQTFPAYLPTTAPSVGANDHLRGQILSGGGSTSLVLSQTAGATLSGVTIVSDDAIPLQNAAAAGQVVYVPSQGVTLNSYTTIGTGSVTRLLLGGPINTNDTLEFTNTSAISGFSYAFATSFTWSGQQTIVGAAFPQVVMGPGGGTMDHVFLNCLAVNGCLNLYDFNGVNLSFDYVSMSTGNGSTQDYLGMNAIFATGGFSYRFYKCNIRTGTPGPNDNSNIGNSPIPGLLFVLGVGNSIPTNNVGVTSSWFLNRSAVDVDLGALGINWVIYKDVQFQSMVLPPIQFTNNSHTTAISPGGIDLQNLTSADRATAYMANYATHNNTGGQVTIQHMTATTGGHNQLTGFPFSGVWSIGTLNLGQTAGIGSFFGNSVGGQIATDGAVEANSVQFNLPITPSAPAVGLSAGGSVPVGTHAYQTVLIDINSNETGLSPATNCVATPGNQTCTVTAPAGVTGAIGYRPYRDNGRANIQSFGSCANAVIPTGVNFVDTFSFTCGVSPNSTLPAAQTGFSGAGMFTPSLRLLNSGFASLFDFPSPLTASRTLHVPDASGTLSLIDVAQTFSATKTLTNASQLRFLSTNGTNYAGFQGGASTINLVWLLPTTDSSGTQCLSSNGSQQFAWSACSGGTGTPGGASSNIQYNNSGSFGGSANLTFDGTGLVGIGLANTTLGKLKLFGSTSGDVTLQPQAVAGTATVLTAPNTSGTIADGASSPLSLSATTGNLTCPTCVTSAASLTANQLLIGAGSQASAGLGSLGTTTTVLHGNAGGAPTFGAVSLTADVSGILPIANGGSGQSTATNAFNALSPITSVGDLIVGNGVNTAGRLAIGTNGLCLVSNGSTPTWNSCAAGAVGGTAATGQGAFWSASSSIAGNANWTYSATSGHSVTQGANAADALFMKRATDSTPTGNFFHFRDNANANDLAKLDVTGLLTVAGGLATTSSTVAGNVNLGQGAATSLIANTITLLAPTAVSGAGEIFTFPGTAASGFIRWTNAANILTGSFAAASGIGACTNTVVTATNDNAPPTCSPTTGAMFGAQAANVVFAGPNGSSGIPTFRSLLSADIPPINLNLGGNGGITNTLPIANGGTNATTAANAFNNLSPLTTAGDVLYGGASGAGTRLAAGTATQLLHSGATPSWSAVSLTADVSGILPLANGGTNASSGLANTNGAVYSDGTKLVSTATGGAGTLCFLSTNGGTPVWGSCAGAAGTAWSSLTNPSGDLSLSMGTNNSLFTHGIMTGTRNAWEITDGASTSTGSILNIHTNASSTMKPFTFTAAGTANGIQMSNTGAVTVLGTGAITATSTTLSISTSAPLGGGGAFNTNLTVTCATCVTSGSSLTNNQLVVGSGGGQGTASGNLSGDVTTSGSLATTIAANAVTSSKMAAVNTRRTCIMIIGADNGTALANADIAPQLQQCQIDAAATVFEIDVRADGGTPNVVAAVRHCTVGACTVGGNETVSDLTSSALATGTAGAAACSKTGATAGLDTFTTCSATLQNTSLAVGDYIETHTATAGGVAKRISIEVHYTVN